MSKSSEEGAAGNASAQEAGAGGGPPKDANENIFDDRAGTKKIIRVVTVMAYVFSVSFAAILLSAYYVFLWEPPNPRLQRHPLAGDPQAEYLIDNLLPIANIDKLNASEFENPNTKFNIFKRIMMSDQEVINYPKKLESFPQNLFAYEDFLELHHKSESKLEDSLADAITSRTTAINDVPKATQTPSGSTVSTLPIFLKTYTIIPTQLTKENGLAPTIPSEGMMPARTLAHKDDGKIGEKEPVDIKIVDLLLGKNTSSLSHKGKNFELLEVSKIPTKRNEYGNESNDSKLPPEIMTDEGTSASSESNTLAVLSTRVTGARVYPRIDNYLYTKTIGHTTVKNNKVTIGIGGTTEASTSPIPMVVSQLEENYDMSLRKHESRLSEDPIDDGLTTTSEVQIYPVEIAEDIIENDK